MTCDICRRPFPYRRIPAQDDPLCLGCIARIRAGEVIGAPSLCSICRRTHGREVRHASE